MGYFGRWLDKYIRIVSQLNVNHPTICGVYGPGNRAMCSYRLYEEVRNSNGGCSAYGYDSIEASPFLISANADIVRVHREDAKRGAPRTTRGKDSSKNRASAAGSEITLLHPPSATSNEAN